MMNVTLDVLQRIVKHKPNNHFARGVLRLIIAEEWDTLFRQKFIDCIPQPDGNNVLPEDNDIIERQTSLFERDFYDFRFRYLYLSAFRKYPPETFYGLDFCADDSLCINKNSSLYIVGGNGSGKTSLYSAIEYLCLGHISAAELRGFSGIENINTYIKYAGCDTSPEICISTNSLNNLTLYQDPPTNFQEIRDFLFPFFCSEYDIFDFMKKGENFDSFIMKIMGMEKLQRLVRKLNEEREEILQQNSVNPDEIRANTNELIRIKDEKEQEIGIYKEIQNDIYSLVHWLKNDIDISDIDISEFEKLKIDENELANYIQGTSESYNLDLKNTLNQKKEWLLNYFPENSLIVKLFQDAIYRCSSQQDDITSLDINDIELHDVGNTQLVMQEDDIRRFNFRLSLLVKEYIFLYKQTKEKKIADYYVDLRNKIEESEKNLLEVSQMLKGMDNRITRYKAHYESLVELIDAINDEISVRKRLILTNTKPLMEGIINDFLFPYERFEIVEDNDMFKAVIYFNNKNHQEIPLTPRNYFNSIQTLLRIFKDCLCIYNQKNVELKFSYSFR